MLGRIETEICDNYCKYPDSCSQVCADECEAEQMLYESFCSKCPFTRL